MNGLRHGKKEYIEWDASMDICGICSSVEVSHFFYPLSAIQADHVTIPIAKTTCTHQK